MKKLSVIITLLLLSAVSLQAQKISAYLSATPLEVVLEVMEDPEGLPTLWTVNLLQGLEDLPPGPGGLLSLRTLRCVLHTQPGIQP